MCLRVSPVVRNAGVCLVIWDDMLGTQNLPKQTQWCNSVWSVRERFETSLSGNEWSCSALSSGQRERWSLFIRWCHHFFLSFVLSYIYFSDSSLLVFITWQIMACLLMLSKWDEREEGERLQEGEWHKESLSYLLKDEILSVQPGCNFLQQVQKGCGGGITPWLSLSFPKLHITI